MREMRKGNEYEFSRTPVRRKKYICTTTQSTPIPTNSKWRIDALTPQSIISSASVPLFFIFSHISPPVVSLDHQRPCLCPSLRVLLSVTSRAASARPFARASGFISRSDRQTLSPVLFLAHEPTSDVLAGGCTIRNPR